MGKDNLFITPKELRLQSAFGISTGNHFNGKRQE